jgi:glycosyltransferase involved in cell wall biosynthesis
MTRLLIVSLNYAPEETGIAPYSTGVAEHLAARGYEVSVIAGMPHYPAWRAREAPARERRNNVEVSRVRHYVPSTHSVIRRGLYEVSSLSLALPALRMRPPDAVLGVIPSLSGGLIARTIAARYRVPYGLVLQDLMSPASRQAGSSGSTAAAGISFMERWALRGATSVGIVADGFRRYVESLGVEPARIRRVRNWSRAAAPTLRRDEMRLLLGWPRDALVCLHAGNMGAKQGLESLIEAARAAAGDPRLLFVLLGDGNRRDELVRRSNREALPNLRIMPLQPGDVFASALGSADILLLNQRGAVREMSLPSKLTSYFAAGRPVVAAVAADSEAAREVAHSGGGIVCAPDDPQALLAAIRRVADDPALASHLAARGQDWSREVLSKDAVMRGYEQLVASVLAASKRGRVAPPVYAAEVAATDERRRAA